MLLKDDNATHSHSMNVMILAEITDPHQET